MSPLTTEFAVDTAKVGGVLSLLGFASWAEAASAAQAAASIAAFVLSTLFIYDWIWRRVLREMFEHYGWVKPKRRRRRDDQTATTRPAHEEDS